MSVNETQMAFGSWDINLKSGDEGVPQELLDRLIIKEEPDGSLGHLIITANHVNPKEIDPLTIARYTGVYRSSEFTETRKRLSGSGLVYWLGDEQDRGPEIPEVTQSLNNISFADAIGAVLPNAIQVGTIVPEIGLQSYTFLFETARTRINEICSRYEAEYYITPQGELNAGNPASLYPTYNAPRCFITRKDEGTDPQYKQLPLAGAALGGDATNFATRKVLVATQDETPVITGEADESTSKRDLHGNLVTITSVSGESGVDGANGDARAAALLAQAIQPRKSNRLSTAKYDIDGTVAVGDSVYVYDPESGYVDTNNKVEYRGQYYFPAKVRVQAVTWPLCLNADGSKPGVYFREPKVGIEPLEDITHDLTPYIVWESQGSTEVVVGTLARSIVPDDSSPLGPIIDPIVNPGAPPGIPDPPQVFGDERNLFVVVPTTTGGVAQPLNVTSMKVYASTTSGFTPDATNYLGPIPVSKANITLGQNVREAFPWFIDALTYVRVTAVNTVEGPASIEVSDAATLIPSAAILSLVADKIDAGTISASVELTAALITGGEINGGIFRTALTGRRVVIDGISGTSHQVQLFSGETVLTESPGVLGANIDGAGGTRRPRTFLESAFLDTVGADAVQMNLKGSSADETLGPEFEVEVGSSSLVISEADGLSMVLGPNSTITLDETAGLTLDTGFGSLVVSPTAYDLSHTLGGQINMDSDMLFMKSPDEFWISGVISDISILGRAAKVEIMNDDATAYRGIKADGFEHANPPTIAGDGAGNAGLYNLLNALDAMGLIVNTVT